MSDVILFPAFTTLPSFYTKFPGTFVESRLSTNFANSIKAIPGQTRIAKRARATKTGQVQADTCPRVFFTFAELMAEDSHPHMPPAYAIKPSSEKPKIPQAAAQPPRPRCSGPTTSSRLVSLLPAACLAFMLYSSFTAVVDSHGDPSTIFFVVSSLSILGLLYLSMREFERAVEEKKDAMRNKLKLAIWSLAMLLNMLFSYRVTSVLQSPVMTWVIWGIAAITSFVACVLLFFFPQPSNVKGEPLQPRTVADPEEGGE